MPSAVMASAKQAQQRKALRDSLIPNGDDALGPITVDEYVCPRCKCDRVRVLSSSNPADCRKNEVWGSRSAATWEYSLTCVDCLHRWTI